MDRVFCYVATAFVLVVLGSCSAVPDERLAEVPLAPPIEPVTSTLVTAGSSPAPPPSEIKPLPPSFPSISPSASSAPRATATSRTANPKHEFTVSARVQDASSGVATAPPLAMAPAEAPPTSAAPLSTGPADRVNPQARALFNAPNSMRRGATVPIKLLVSLTGSAEELHKQLGDAFPGARIEKSIDAAPTLIATLKGPTNAFDIQELGATKQVLESANHSWWEWRVTAKREGSYKLQMTLTAERPAGSQNLVVMEHDIEVNVDPADRLSDFVSSEWKWLYATLLVPLAAFGWNWWKKRGTDTGTGYRD